MTEDPRTLGSWSSAGLAWSPATQPSSATSQQESKPPAPADNPPDTTTRGRSPESAAAKSSRPTKKARPGRDRSPSHNEPQESRAQTIIWFPQTSPTPYPNPVQVLKSLMMYGRVRGLHISPNATGVEFMSASAAKALSMSSLKVYPSARNPATTNPLPENSNAYLCDPDFVLPKGTFTIESPPQPTKPDWEGITVEAVITSETPFSHRTRSAIIRLLHKFGFVPLSTARDVYPKFTCPGPAAAAFLSDSWAESASTNTAVTTRAAPSGTKFNITLHGLPPSYMAGPPLEVLISDAYDRLHPIMSKPEMLDTTLHQGSAFLDYRQSRRVTGLDLYPNYHHTCAWAYRHRHPETTFQALFNSYELCDLNHITLVRAIEQHYSPTSENLFRNNRRDLYLRLSHSGTLIDSMITRFIEMILDIFQTTAGMQLITVPQPKLRPHPDTTDPVCTLHLITNRLPVMGLQLDPVLPSDPHVRNPATLDADLVPSPEYLTTLTRNIAEEVLELQDHLRPILIQVTSISPTYGDSNIKYLFTNIGTTKQPSPHSNDARRLLTYLMVGNALAAASASHLLIAPDLAVEETTSPQGDSDGGDSEGDEATQTLDDEDADLAFDEEVRPAPFTSDPTTAKANSGLYRMQAKTFNNVQVSRRDDSPLQVNCHNPWLHLEPRLIWPGVLELYDQQAIPLNGSLPTLAFASQLKNLSFEGDPDIKGLFTFTDSVPELGAGVEFLEAIGSFDDSRTTLTLTPQ